MVFFREHFVSKVWSATFCHCSFSNLIYTLNGEYWTGLLTTQKSQSVLLYQILYKQIKTTSHLQALVFKASDSLISSGGTAQRNLSNSGCSCSALMVTSSSERYKSQWEEVVCWTWCSQWAAGWGGEGLRQPWLHQPWDGGGVQGREKSKKQAHTTWEGEWGRLHQIFLSGAL